MRQIIQNEIKCNSCDDIIWSAHRHDYKKCKCGKVFVDGGMAYIRRTLLTDEEEFTDRAMSMEEDSLKKCVDAVQWARDNRRNDLGTVLAVIRALRDEDCLKESKFKDDGVDKNYR